MSEMKHNLRSKSKLKKTSDPKEIPRKEFCLYYEVQRRRWLKCKAILERSDASRYVHYSPKILFYACIYNAPIEIVKSIYHFDPSQVCYQNDAVELILGKSHDAKVTIGHTPLLWTLNQFNYRAMKLQACNFQTFRKDHEADDAKNADQVLNFLLDIASTTEYGARSAKMAGRDGSLPLHVATILNIPQSRTVIIRKLLVANPDAIHMRANGKTPFLLKCLDMKYVAKLCNFKFNEYNPGMKRERFNKEEWGLTKDIFLLFLEVLACGKLAQNGFSLPLHTGLSIEDLPLIALLFLVDMFPGHFYKKDENGNFPLHIAFSYAHFIPDEYTSNFDKQLVKLIHEKIYMSSKLALKVPNHNGHTPLSLAIQTGYPFEHELVQHLLQVNPESISQCYANRGSIDGTVKPGLHLFMEAAISERASLNTLYELMKLNPSLLHA